MATGKKQYYKSWASYHIPMRPTDPIEYAATERLKAFYLAEYDDSGNLIRFTKYLREHDGRRHTSLSPMRLAGSSIYFTAVPEGEGRFKAGAEIAYQATEGVSEYFHGLVNKSGDAADLDLVRTAIFFDDEYSYWPNKQLRTRAMHKKDGTVTRSSYDESGNEIRNQ